MSLSILILTLNEEENLPGCLDSVGWSNDVVVLDSLSNDGTVQAAERAGARVYQRQFDNFASQRNYALDHIDFRNDWVFHLDADERITTELRDECYNAIKNDQYCCYLVPSKTMFMGRWLRWAAMYPVYQMRFLKHSEVRYIQKGHGQRENQAQNGVGRLQFPYIHYPFSKGLDDWFTKHNRYSSQEAAQWIRNSSEKSYCWRTVLSRDAVRRHRALKDLSFRLPFRPLLRFLYMYILRGGFLDGTPGLTYCQMLTIYEYMIVSKIREHRQRENGSSI